MATFTADSEWRRIFIPGETDDNGKVRRFPVWIGKATVVVECYGEKIVFSKGNRANRVQDSRLVRGPRSKDLSLDEAKEELIRLLGESDGREAFAALRNI